MCYSSECIVVHCLEGPRAFAEGKPKELQEAQFGSGSSLALSLWCWGIHSYVSVTVYGLKWELQRIVYVVPFDEILLCWYVTVLIMHWHLLSGCRKAGWLGQWSSTGKDPGTDFLSVHLVLMSVPAHCQQRWAILWDKLCEQKWRGLYGAFFTTSGPYIASSI